MLTSKHEVANVDEVLLYARFGAGMISRRKGKMYAKSEWKLFKLKRRFRLQGSVGAFTVFMLRVIPRLFPTKVLEVLCKKII